MSCWRNYTCVVLKNVDKRKLESALKEMGLGIDNNVKCVESKWENRKEICDAVLTKNGKNLSLGIIYSDDTRHMKVVGDFWGTGVDESTFVDSLSQIYQKINCMLLAELNGYTVETVETNAEGEIEVYCAMEA